MSLRKAIGAVICKLKGKHDWGKAKDYPVLSGVDRVTVQYHERGKHCEKCGIYALVKRRVKKEVA